MPPLNDIVTNSAEGPQGPQGAYGSNQLSSDLDANSYDIYNAETVTFDAEYDNGNSGASATVDWNNGQKQTITLTDDCTISFTDPRGVCNIVLRIVQDGTGGWSVTWPVDVGWPGGTAPTLTSDASAIDIVSFYFDGTYYYGVASLDFQFPGS